MPYELKKEIPVHSWRDNSRGISFYIDRIERVDPEVNASYPHRDLFYTIYYIKEGKGIHFIDFKSHRIETDSLFFLSPGLIHFWQVESTLKGTLIAFRGDFFRPFLSEQNLINDLNFFHNIDGSPKVVLKGEGARSISLVMQLMEEEFVTGSYGCESNLQSYLRILLTQIQRSLMYREETSASKKGLMITRNFRTLVQEHFLLRNSLSFYADRLGISVEHLYDVVKKTSGLSPGQIIRIEIVLEIKRLLAYTNLPVSEIGYKLNFEDPSYFSRFFKRETGMSPKDFRSRILEKYHFSLF